MKEASGELSMTAIAVVAIAAVGVVFTTIVWPRIKKQLENNLNCQNAISCDCVTGSKTCNCIYLDESNNQQRVVCANPDK